MAALVWAFRLDERFGVRIVGDIPASLPHFWAPRLEMEPGAAAGRRRLRHCDSRPAGGRGHGQGHRRPHRSGARHQPAMPQRRGGQPGGQLLPVHSRVGVADAVGGQSAGRGGDAVVGSVRGSRRGRDGAAVCAAGPVHPAGRLGRPAHAGGLPHGGSQAAPAFTCGRRGSMPAWCWPRPWPRSSSRWSFASSSASFCRSSCTCRGPLACASRGRSPRPRTASGSAVRESRAVIDC